MDWVEIWSLVEPILDYCAYVRVLQKCGDVKRWQLTSLLTPNETDVNVSYHMYQYVYHTVFVRYHTQYLRLFTLVGGRIRKLRALA